MRKKEKIQKKKKNQNYIKEKKSEHTDKLTKTDNRQWRGWEAD